MNNVIKDPLLDKILHPGLSDEDIAEILKKAEPNISNNELESQILRYRLLTISELEIELKEKLKTGNSFVENIDQFRNLNQQLKEIDSKKKQIETELNVLIRPIQQQLPDIFENKRLVPNSFLRGALFGIVKKGKRSQVRDVEIFNMSQYEIKFTGEYLDQNDLELWDSLIYLAKNKHIDSELEITLYELRKFMGYTQSKLMYDAIMARAERLKIANIKVKKGRTTYIGSLIDEVYIDEAHEGKLIIRFNKKLVNLFSEKDYTIISVDIRRAIGENQLSRWLYNFYETHRDPIPFEIDFIRKLCRSEANIYKFKSMLKEAIELVRKAHLVVGREFKYEIKKNTLYVSKSKYQNLPLEPIDLFNNS